MVSYTNRHNISRADGLFYGDGGSYAPAISKWLRAGQPITGVFMYDFEGATPAATKATGIATFNTSTTAATIAFSGSGTYATNGPPKSGGKATLDIARTVRVANVNTMSSAQTIVLYGKDYYGEALSQQVGITNTISGSTLTLKAFKTLSAIVLQQKITAKGAVTIGVGNGFGLPFCLEGAWGALSAWAGTTAQTISSTVVTAADTTSPATALTGDIRGTLNPTTAPDGSTKYRIWFTAKGKDTRNNLYGVPNA